MMTVHYQSASRLHGNRLERDLLAELKERLEREGLREELPAHLPLSSSAF